jgi:hypothetical protein
MRPCGLSQGKFAPSGTLPVAKTGAPKNLVMFDRNRSRGQRSLLDRRDIPVPPDESAGLENPAYRGFLGSGERLPSFRSDCLPQKWQAP